jgi:serine/threonine-protein kinase
MQQASIPSGMGRGTFVLAVIFFSLVAFVVSALVTTRALKRETVVEVPNVSGKPLEEARSTLRVKRLNIEIKEFQFNEKVPLNYIINQIPKQGAKVKSGRPVQVIVSRGTQTVEVPKLKNMKIKDALLLLQEQKINLGKTTRLYDSEIEKDMVIDQNPISGSQIGQGDTVDLLISQGPKPVWYVMPNLDGKNIDEATETLNFMGMEIREIKRVNNDLQPPGVVFDQIPAPGNRVKEGDFASLTITSNQNETGASARLVTMEYLVPDLNREVRIKLMVRDATGLHEIHNAMERANTAVRKRKTIYGENARLFIYVNGQLQEERNL